MGKRFDMVRRLETAIKVLRGGQSLPPGDFTRLEIANELETILVAGLDARKLVCPECGYTEEDARMQMDHKFCKNYGKAPWSDAIGEVSS